ncbi:MAG TPA: bifunctional nuclease family protein [Polyangia bacterium]|nr:bifunctional nuclease family protein [Polyangia bacterium]
MRRSLLVLAALWFAPTSLASAQSKLDKPEKSEKSDKPAEKSDKPAPPPAASEKNGAGERPDEARSHDWSEAEVWQVMADPGGGGIVLLRTKANPRRIIPIAIGPSEALSIQMKLAGTSFVRPLTHDLLDTLVKQLGAKVVKVRIEKLEAVHGRDAGTFFGRVFVRQGKRQFDLDARASDSIAIALRADAPIFVATPVVEKTGLDAKKFEEEGDVESPLPRPKSRPPSEPL